MLTGPQYNVENEECISGDDHPRRASCFYIVPTAGCLVPGESKDFYIEFHPRFSGSFMETWILCFTPKLSTSLQALHLHGAAAVPEDVNRSSLMCISYKGVSMQVVLRERNLRYHFIIFIANSFAVYCKESFCSRVLRLDNELVAWKKFLVKS